MTKTAQLNIRVDEDVLRAYKDFCDRNALHPHKQLINFMRWMSEAHATDVAAFLSWVIDSNKKEV